MKNQIAKNISYPFIVERCGIYVIVQEREGDVFVTCPFQSCKTGFVDILDKTLSAGAFPGVILYQKIDDFLTCVQISDRHSMSAYTAYTLICQALDSLIGLKLHFDKAHIELAQKFKWHIVKSGLVQYLG